MRIRLACVYLLALTYLGAAVSIQSLRDRIIAEMRQCHDDAVYTHPAVTEWGVDSELSDSKTLAEIIARGVHPEISTVNLLDWRESVNGTYDPSGGLPASPSTGDRWIATATANGWTEDSIYTWDGSTWSAFAPDAGCTVWSEAVNKMLTYYSNAWQDTPMSIPAHASDHGIGGSDPVTIATSQVHGFVEAVQDRVSELLITDPAYPGIRLQYDDTRAELKIGFSLLGMQDLTDPSDDRIIFWDNSEKKTAWLDIGSGLTLSGTTLALAPHAGNHGMNGSDPVSLDWSQVATGRTDYVTRWPTWTEVTSKPSEFSPSAHASTHEMGGTDELELSWHQIVSGKPATATRWPTWSEVTSKPTDLITGTLSSGHLVKAIGEHTVEYALLQEISVGSEFYTDCYSHFRIVTPDTSTASNKVVVFGSSNKLERRDIDSRVWGSSLISGTMTSGYMPVADGEHSLTNSIVQADAATVTIGGSVRIGANSISNGGTGGLTFDTFGNAFFAYDVTVTGRIQVDGSQGARIRRGLTGGYGVSSGSGNDWGSNIWSIGDSWSGTGYGTSYTIGASSQYGLSWLRDTHPSVDADAGEGLYLYRAGVSIAALGYKSSRFFKKVLIGGNSISNNGTGGLTFDASGNAIFNGYAQASRWVYSHVTSSSGSGGSGHWTRIARANITSQYSSTSSTILVNGITSGASSALTGRILFRVKQQNSLGNAPFINVFLFDAHRLESANIAAVTVQNDASATIVDLYIQYPDSYLSYNFTPMNVTSDSNIIFYSSDGVVSSLPAGTQNAASEKSFFYDSSTGDATAPRDIYTRALHATSYSTFTTANFSSNVSISGNTSFGGRLQLGSNYISSASADRGLRVDSDGTVTFRVDGNFIKNVAFESGYGSVGARSFIGQRYDNCYITNNAFFSAAWQADDNSMKSTAIHMTPDGDIRLKYANMASSTTWYSLLGLDGQNRRAGINNDTPDCTLHVSVPATSGEDVQVFKLTTASGGGFYIANSDLSSGTPTWKFWPYWDESMSFIYNGDVKLEIASKVQTNGRHDFIPSDGGNSHINFDNKSHYLTCKTDGGTVFRTYNTSTSAYTNVMKVTGAAGFEVYGAMTVSATATFSNRVYCALTDSAKGALFFDIDGASSDGRLWEVSYDGNQTLGYYLDYKGSGSGDENYLELWSHNGDMLYRAHYSSGQFRIPGLFSRGTTKNVSFGSGSTALTVDKNYIDVTSVDSGGGTSIVLASEGNTRGDWCVIENSSGSGYNIYLDGGISRKITVQGSDRMVFCAKVADGQWYAVKMA